MSYVSSAGIARGAPGYGKTCRKDVLRRVQVPVMPGAAGRARPAPRRKAQLREQVPASRAGLAGGIPAADHDQFPADALATAQQAGDVLGANAAMMDAYSTDVRPLLGELREETGLDPDPVTAYARSGHGEKIIAERVGGTPASWGS